MKWIGILLCAIQLRKVIELGYYRFVRFQFREDHQKQKNDLELIVRQSVLDSLILKGFPILKRLLGINSLRQTRTYIIWCMILPTLLLLLRFVSGDWSWSSLFIWLMPTVLYRYNISAGQKKRKRSFERHAYKIYKYMYNQLSSGVRVSDVISTIFLPIQEKTLRSALLNFSARYMQTMNIDYALNALREEYSGFEIESFCLAVKQGIETGNNQPFLKKQEEIMFNKYFMTVQRDTDLVKWQCTFIVFVQCLILVFMIGIPLLMDLNRALSQIMLN